MGNFAVAGFGYLNGQGLRLFKKRRIRIKHQIVVHDVGPARKIAVGHGQCAGRANEEGAYLKGRCKMYDYLVPCIGRRIRHRTHNDPRRIAALRGGLCIAAGRAAQVSRLLKCRAVFVAVNADFHGRKITRFFGSARLAVGVHCQHGHVQNQLIRNARHQRLLKAGADVFLPTRRKQGTRITVPSDACRLASMADSRP